MSKAITLGLPEAIAFISGSGTSNLQFAMSSSPQPTFSIITPSYNQLDWLRLCVASVRDQVNCESRVESRESRAKIATDQSLPSSLVTRHSSPLRVEHLIQDAGTSGIEDFAREIGADFYRDGELVFSSAEHRRSEIGDRGPTSISQLPASYRITVYCESDNGMYDAINRGLARASGGLCAYLNCDEQYLSGTLQSVCEWFAMHPHTDVLFADALLLDGAGQPLSYRRTVLPDRWHTRLCHLNTLTCSTFFRRKIFEAGHQFPADRKIIGDGVWVDGMLAARVPMDYLKQLTSTFTFTGTNLSELDSGANSEQRRWLAETGWPPAFLRKPVSALHRLKKLLAGAYSRRDCEVAIYLPGNETSRQKIRVRSLGSSWPRTAPREENSEFLKR